MLARQIGFVVLALVCTLSMSSCAERRMDEPGGSGQRHFSKKFSVSPGGALVVRTDAGSVRIQGGGSSEVSIEADINGRERDVERFTVTADQSGNNVEVKGDLRGGGGFFSGLNNFNAIFTITVPREYNVEVHTAGGEIEISEVKGSLKGGTSGGDVAVKGIEGTVDLNTSGGEVRAENVHGQVRMSTSGGDARMAMVVGDVEAKTSGGNVTVEGVDGAVNARTSGGNVSVRLTGQNKGIHAETSGGNIELVLLKSTNANVDLSTSGGDVNCDLPVTVTGRIHSDEVRGTLNGGGPTILGHTSGGNVNVRAQ